MKNRNTSVQPAKPNLPAVRTPQDRMQKVLQDLMKNNPEQTVTVDDMVDRLPKINPTDIELFMQTAPGGDFIAGRRGHPSRFVFGEALEKWRHQEEIRAEWRKRNGFTPTGGRRQTRVGRPSVTVKPAAQTSQGLSREMVLKVTIGDQEVSIPLKAELEEVQ